MLKIDTNIFSHNLKLTQAYCHLQLDKEKDKSKILRTFNPVVNDNPLFLFKVEHFDFYIEPGINYCTETLWTNDPTESGNEKLVSNLFEQQISFKEKQVSPELDRPYQGDILISKIDGTVIDGASEVQSLGLIDMYDMPPIDTWFYMTNSNEGQLLFAWIPKDLRHYANEAVLVNCVDCINWFQEWYPQEYEVIMAKAQQHTIIP